MTSTQLLPDSKTPSGVDGSGTHQVAEHGPDDRRGIEDGVFATLLVYLVAIFVTHLVLLVLHLVQLFQCSLAHLRLQYFQSYLVNHWHLLLQGLQ